MRWREKTAEEILKELNSGRQGLSSKEASLRLKKYGPNELREKKRKTPYLIFLDQFRNFMIIALIIAALISGVIGEPSDTVAILFIIVLNATIGFFQEYRAEKALESLKKISAPTACVIRDGEINIIPASDLVPGDITLLEAGNITPADLRLIEVESLQIDESSITGESEPVDKICDPLSDKNLTISDSVNLAFMGSCVTRGRCVGVVYATGMDTELGKIASMLQTEKKIKTPLQKKLELLGRKLAVAILLICAVIFTAGVLRGEDLALMLLTSISLAVAAIPEALPAVITISLAIGAKKLVDQNALIRSLPAVETLGSITYICADKTGTLTTNKITVESLFVDNAQIHLDEISYLKKTGSNLSHYDTYSLLLTAMALSNDLKTSSENSFRGDPTETALCEAASKMGYFKSELETIFPRVAAIPFDSTRKLMTTIHSLPEGGYISFTKGAADIIFEKALNIMTTSGFINIHESDFSRINSEMTSRGLRVLCVAMKKLSSLPADISSAKLENELTILGLVGMLDIPRPEAIKSVSICKNAGIQPVMITGDHPETAKTIAKRLGILDENHKSVITGKELEQLSEEALAAKSEQIRVYARVAPEQKLKIVKALQANGQIVAMTGDGVNDAPALKKADIGVAMGLAGTDVAKQASDIILLDDNFSTIVKAVQEGRKIYDNIRKIIKYLLTTNSAEVLAIFIAPFLGLPLPLLPIQLLWVNLVTDGLPAIALSAEKPEKNIMDRPPRPPDESVFAHGLGIHVIWVSMLMSGIILFAESLFINMGNERWQTMVFTAMCLTQLGHALAIKSETTSFFKMKISSNIFLIATIIITIVIQLAIIYTPALNEMFKTKPLSFGELMFTFALSSLVFAAVEIEKYFKRRKNAF